MADRPVPTYAHDRQSLLYTNAATDLLHMFVVWGQSLAVGANDDAADLPISTTALYPDSVWMFDAGVHPDRRPVTGFVGLREGASEGIDPPSDRRGRETLCSGFANTLHEKIGAATGQRQRILMAVAARNGADYARIQRGSRTWAEAIRLTAAAARIAGTRHLRVRVDIICQHGESDFKGGTGRHAYARMLTQARANFQADLAPITGQSDPVRMFVAQCNRGKGGDPRTPTAVRDAASADPLIIESGPIYHTTKDAADPAKGGGRHPSCASYIALGEQHCLAVLGELHSTGYQPTRRIAAWWQTGHSIRLRYNKPVVIDTSGAVIGTAGLEAGGTAPWGFVFADGAAGVTPTIVSCGIVPGTRDTIELTLSGPPAGRRAQLFYATRATGTGCGRLDGARGLIRAAAAYGTSRAPGGMPLYEWACVDAFDLPPI